MTMPPILTRDHEHLRRLIDPAQSVRVWLDWGFESDGSYVPLDKPTVLRMLCGSDGAFECHQNGVGVLFIARIPDNPQTKESNMARKTADPKLIALLDHLAKAQADAERWYGKMKRAFNRLDKARRTVARLEKRIEQHRSLPSGVNSAAV